MKIYYIPTSAGIVFGSGSASVVLNVEGERVHGEVYRSGPFVGTDYTLLAPLRAARHVKYCASYYPGGTRKFEGSGAHFVKWALMKGEAVDEDGNHAPAPRKKDVLSPRPVWERQGDLIRRLVARVNARVPQYPDISGGKVVPYHFYTDEGRWEEWPPDRGSPSFNSNGLPSWGGLIVKRYGTWFVAPDRIQAEVARCKRTIPW